MFGSWQQQGVEKLPRGDGADISCRALALWGVEDAVSLKGVTVSQPVISSCAKLEAFCAASAWNFGCDLISTCLAAESKVALVFLSQECGSPYLV